MTNIHPTSIIGASVRLEEDVFIGPYCVVEGEVTIGRGSKLQSHVVVQGITRIGAEVTIFPFACIGMVPQHLKYKGEPTRVEIGDNTIIRECVTVHRGTSIGSGLTSVGSHCYLMAYVHVAHDCKVGSRTIIANSVQLAGHVEIGEGVNLGGQSAVIQFCRVGDGAFVGGGSVLRKDLPPFMLGKGGDFIVQGINSIGLTRQGIDQQDILALKKLYKIFYLENLTVQKATEKIRESLLPNSYVEHFLKFVEESKMGIIRNC